MKIATIICEYNPFHNGHKYAIEQIKANTKCDALAVIMSGNFTQRGEIAVMDKYTRAVHAIKSGADIVFELPVAFATAPAEIFAKGAVKLLNGLVGEKTLCFGVESGDKQSLISTAKLLSNESKQYKSALKQQLKNGVSLAKAKYEALKLVNPPDTQLDLLVKPNNILGIEYMKAIVEKGYDFDIYPILRQGAEHNDIALNGQISSALSIRNAITEGKVKSVKKAIPEYVYGDLPKTLPNCSSQILYSLLSTDKSRIKEIIDCTEGLENRIKTLIKDNFDYDVLLEKLCTKRYTATRLKRIMLSCMLGITEKKIKRYLNGELYLKTLAIKSSRLDLLCKLKDKNPFIVRKADSNLLNGVAKDCFNDDVFANDLYNQITNKKTNEYETKIVNL